MLLFFFGSLTLQAQTAEIPPPRAPFVATPKPGTSWLITITYGDDSGLATGMAIPQARRPVSILTHCGTGLSLVVLTWSDGTKTSAYIQGNRYIQKSPETGAIYALPVQDGDRGFAVFTKGYPGTTWLTAGNYRKVEPQDKRLAYYFHESISGAEPQELDAWIEVKDGIPVRVKMGEMVYRFGPVTEAPAQIELPPDFQAFVARAGKEQKALEWMMKASKPQ